MSVTLQFKLTQAGQAAVWNSTNTGLALSLTHIQFGSGRRAPTGTELALLTPKQAVPIAAGFRVSPTQIRMTAIFGGTENYTISEVGLWAGDPASGTSKLIGYYSQADADLAIKSAGVDFIFSHDMKLDAALPAGSLTILADNSQSAMLAMILAHESAPDPHPQYLLKTTYLTGGRLTAGAALPTTDIGPVWHDDYGSFITWQTFNQNGANYSGYASSNIGSLLLDTQQTPRKGYIKSGVSNLSRTAYAALRNWAIHNGVLVASASWAAGTLLFKDNADGTTFTVADVRGAFPRFWDDGRGIDTGRGFGSSQDGTAIRIKSPYPANYVVMPTITRSDADPFVNVGAASREFVLGTVGSLPVGYEGNPDSFGRMRPTNVALLAAIKF